MDLTDAEIGELDDLLAAVPAPCEALDVVAVDGFLCGLLSLPVAVETDRWLPLALDWNAGEEGSVPLRPDAAGWHAAKHERLTVLLLRRMEALNEAIIGEGWFDPIVMQAQDDAGRPLQGQAGIEASLGWWVMGFEHAMNHFPELLDLQNPEIPDLLACLYRHLPEKTEDELAYAKALDQEHPLSTLDAAIEDLVVTVSELANLGRAERVKVVTVRRGEPRTGRNDPCHCGSGKKYKYCHGAGH